MRFELGPASTMFLMGRSKQRNYLIRLWAVLYEPIDERILQSALERTLVKYPWFFIRFTNIRNHLFAEPAAHIPPVKEKKDASGMKLWEGHEGCEAQVSYSGNAIFLEFSHAVSDGKGGLEFLAYLTAAYLSTRYQDESILQSVVPISKEDQLENGYRKYAKGFQTKRIGGPAFRITGAPGTMNITSYSLPVDEMKRAARAYGASITEFMAALLCSAIAAVQKENVSQAPNKRIRLLIPVDLRTRFPCHTMRNFTLNISLEAWPKDTENLSGLCARFHHSMQSAVKPEKLAGQCASISKLCDSGIVRGLPLAVKKWFVQMGLDSPLSANTLTFSNMGAVLWPEQLKSRIEALGLAFSTKPEAPYSCSAISINGTMRLTLARTIVEPVLERQLEKILCAQSIVFKKYDI